MIILNFAEPLTSEDISAVAAMHGRRVRQVLGAPAAFSPDLPLAPQVKRLLDGLGLSRKDWQTMSLVVCLPEESAAAAVLVAEIAGRRGRTPTVVRFRTDGATGRREPSEVISLHEVRKEAQQSSKGWIPPANHRDSDN